MVLFGYERMGRVKKRINDRRIKRLRMKMFIRYSLIGIYKVL